MRRWYSRGLDATGPRRHEHSPPPRIPCPFVYADGRFCQGHIVRIETYKADLVWEMDETGRWRFDLRRGCVSTSSAREGQTTRASSARTDAMKDWLDRLPEAAQEVSSAGRQDGGDR
jgi:hypothetical protein